MTNFYLPPSFIKRREYTVKNHVFSTILVEKGSFMMGSETNGDEKPIHEVTMSSDFELGQYQVTQALWLAVTGIEFPNVHFIGAERPIENISWNYTQEFFQAINQWYADSEMYTHHPGLFALPTEAQWEYAARGGRFGSVFFFEYSGGNRLEEVGWFGGNSRGETNAIGLKQPNVLGLFDMSGNVFEWCEDDWHINYENAPRDGSAWLDNPRSPLRISRGGSWINIAGNFRVAHRDGDFANNKRKNLGFRIAFNPLSDY